jgi:hypothetical protein
MQVETTFEAHRAVTRTDHLFHRAASAHDKAPGDDRLSLRSAALAIVGLSLLGWAILLIFVFRLFGSS